MTKLYYDCGYAALIMHKTFGVKFNMNFAGYETTMVEDDILETLHDAKKKYYIHSDSLYIYDYRGEDFIKIVIECDIYGEKEIIIKHCELLSHFPDCEILGIVERDNKPFHIPLS